RALRSAPDRRVRRALLGDARLRRARRERSPVRLRVSRRPIPHAVAMDARYPAMGVAPRAEGQDRPVETVRGLHPDAGAGVETMGLITSVLALFLLAVPAAAQQPTEGSTRGGIPPGEAFTFKQLKITVLAIKVDSGVATPHEFAVIRLEEGRAMEEKT